MRGSFRASGVLDEGNDVNPSFAVNGNDHESLLPKSITTMTGESEPTRQRGNIRIISNTISNVRGRITGRPPTYPRTPDKFHAQRQEIKLSKSNNVYTKLKNSPPPPPPQQQQKPIQQQQQSLPETTTQTPQTNRQKIITPRTMPTLKILKEQSQFESESESDYYDTDDDDEYHMFCCDEDGCNFQPSRHCNEGMKNLCTIALWAIIVFAVVNRFLMQLGTFYAKGRSVERIKNNAMDKSLEQRDFAVDGKMEKVSVGVNEGSNRVLEFDVLAGALALENDNGLRGRRNLF